jgi:hypothetical protein
MRVMSMKHAIAIAVSAVSLSTTIIATDVSDFPLKLHVLGESEQSRDIKRLWPDPCIQAGMGAGCSGYDKLPPPGWAVDVLTVTARLTQRGRTIEYELECRTAVPKRPCAPMKYGEYRARWRGKRLEVLVTDGAGKGTVNQFDIKGEHDADPN